MPKEPSKQNPSPSSARIVINKDGSLNIHRTRETGKLFSDLYHFFLAISWPKFFFSLVFLFFVTNFLFGTLYFYAGPGALEGAHPELGMIRFVECFFFSVQLFNAPYTPQSIWCNVLVTIQSYLGLLTIVIVTGLLYARFARPNAQVLFSDHAIITTYDKRPCLTFRVANERQNQIIEAHMTLVCTKNYMSAEGESSRKFYPMKLECDYSPLFALSWTIRHFIDDDSPLRGMDERQMKDSQVVIFASLSGIDDTFSQTITARSVYRFDEIVYNKRFKDIITWDKNKVRINLKGINQME